MYSEGKIYIAKSENRIYMEPKMCNRHGLIAGATGTGKTITLKVMAESFSAMGVPVFMADVKGDLSGMVEPGVDSESMQKRIEKFGIKDEFKYRKFPTRFWDVYGESGHPVRASISELGPEFLARMMDLTDVQTGVLQIVFRVADDNGWFLIDLKDLRSMLTYCGEHRSEISLKYGNVATASIGAIQRAVLTIEDNGGNIFFGEPSLDIFDWIRTDVDGRGFINILHCVELIKNPRLYAIFMLWMMTELYENMPEVGDLEKPRIVFFFDEAHLLFNDAPKVLVQKIETVIKLIRSKGVGIYFISQSPSDLPDTILAQLSNRVQHALRAYTPAEQKAVKIAAQTFRVNPNFNTEDAIMELETGEALVSFLDEKGAPTVVERAYILPPESKMGACEEASRTTAIKSSEFDLKYGKSIDRESAYEILTAQNDAKKAEEEAEAKAKAEEEAKKQEEAEKAKEEATKQKEEAAKAKAEQAAAAKAEKEAAAAEKKAAAAEKKAKSQKSTTSKLAERAMGNLVGSASSTIGRTITNKIIRGIFGNISK